MAMITKNEYGVVAVNNSVLTKMIINNLLSFEEDIVPCTRKGKVIRKGFFTGYNDFGNAIEIIEQGTRIRVRIYIVAKFDGDITGISEQLFNLIEEDFDVVCLDKPEEIRLTVLGVLYAGEKQPHATNVDIIRKNN